MKKFVPYATINPLIFQKSQQRQKAILKLENPGSYDDKERMRNMEKLDMLYEGKAKKVYKTDDENAYIVEYKDDATAFNGLKKGTIAGKA